MDSIATLREVIARQREQLRQMEEAVGALERTDAAQENQRLKALAQGQARELDEAKQAGAALAAELDDARWALREQRSAEREQTLRAARERARHYFGAAHSGSGSRLDWLEGVLRQRVDGLRARLDGLAEEDAAQYRARLDAIEGEIERSLGARREAAQAEWAREGELMEDDWTGMSKREMPPPRPARATRTEMLIGQRVLQVIGLLIVLLGVVFGLQLTYTHLLTTDAAKGVSAFALGLLFLGAGGWMERRRGRNPFAIGLNAGGIAILYIATAVSYFQLHILTTPVALGLCVGVTALALVLSIQKEAQLIAIFALVGGHMPLIAVDSDALLYAALGYLLLLNLFSLLIGLRRKWLVMNFVSFALYGLSTLATLIVLPDAYDIPVFRAVRFGYLALTFLLFVALVLARPMRQSVPLGRADVVLLSLNTVYHGTFMLSLFRADAPQAAGLVALLYAAIFFSMALLARRFYAADPHCPVLFYAAAFAFLALFPPMQFGALWFGIAWFAEGCVLAVFGILTGRRWYERAGLVLLLAGGIWSLPTTLWAVLTEGFLWPFAAAAVSLAVVAAAYLAKCGFRPESLTPGRRNRTLAMLYGAIPVLWLFFLYLCGHFGGDYRAILAMYATLLYSLALRYLPRARTNVVRGYADGAVAAAFLMAFSVNSMHFDATWKMLAALGPVNLLLFGAAFALARDRAADRSLHPQFQVILPTAALLVQCTFLSMRQFRLPFAAMELSFFFLAVALCWVVLGFVKRYRAVRLMGLSLSLAAVAKLFLLDLSHLESWQRIVSYFVFGGVLIGISYVYTFFSRRVDRGEKEEAPAEE